MQKIWNELIVAFEFEIAHIEKNHAIGRFDALFQNADGLAMALQQGREMFFHQRQFENFRERTAGHLWNELWDEQRLRSSFDDQSELHRRLLQAHGRVRRSELSAVNNVGPLDKLGQRTRVESEFLRGNSREKFRARLVARIVKLFPGMVCAKVGRVCGT